MLIIFLILAIYTNLLEEFLPFFSYTDEFFTIILTLYGIVSLFIYSKRNETIFNKFEKIAFLFSILVVLTGVLSTVLSDYRNSLFNEIYTLFGDVKFILIYFGIRLYCHSLNKQKFKRVGKYVISFSYIFTGYNLLLFFLDLPFNFLTEYSYRFGMKNVAFGFGHPSEFAISLLLITTLNLYFSIKYFKKINYIYLFLNLFLLIIGGRLTSIGFYIVILLLLISYRYFRRYIVGGLIVSGVVGFIFVKDKLIETFFSLEQPRGVLMVAGLKISQEHFPLGSGFGTYGSNAARLIYSHVYYEFGFDKIYGLAPWYDNFLTDSYWAMILGEIGILGAILMLIVMIFLLLNAYSINKSTVGLIVSIPLFYTFLSTPVDTAIVSNSAFSIMVIAGLLITVEKKDKTEILRR
ncbi:hypothetical protein CHH58_10355 [Terribacillus saccharophilus]|uniref:hypothetical protein n=1 Tax=Terribacillus saccharophilus TaxID=361277 RepID=UPI000BA56CF9|nr:hypothetical protein [Terribacillus saccharophilus]PAF37231.1 hypothetical protein CHH58_10355 [Terribacillus saccharophilus]